MANNCLVTTLSGAVDNSELDVLGKLRLVNKRDAVSNLTITPASGELNLKTENGHFTNSAGTSDEGTTGVSRAGTNYTRYVTPNTVVYADKYNISYLNTQLSLKVEDLAYEENLSVLRADNGSGDVSSLKTTVLHDLMCRGADYYGDINALITANQNTLENLGISNSNITFNLENKSFPLGLKVDKINESTQGMDLSSVIDLLYFQSDSTYIRNLFTWTRTSNSSQWICVLYYIRLATSQDIDNMFICLADGKTISPKMTASWEKTIIVYGGAHSEYGRTSASDSAVATLKGLGLTIKVNGVTQ